MKDMDAVYQGGELRYLGCHEQDPEALTRAWPVVGDPGTAQLVPREKWVPLDLSGLKPELVNQNGIGMCCSCATVNALELARSVAGLPRVALSGGDLYKRVSGGVDRGSLLEDNLKELLDRGIAPVSVVPFLDWRGNHPAAAAERPKYRGLEAWQCPTVDHVGSALQAGFPVVIGYWHHQYDPPGPGGWMTNPGGRRGGHSVCLYGVVTDSGRWGFKFPNHWGNWGDHGYGVLPESRIAEGLRSFPAWCLRASAVESGGTPQPPA